MNKAVLLKMIIQLLLEIGAFNFGQSTCDWQKLLFFAS